MLVEELIGTTTQQQSTNHYHTIVYRSVFSEAFLVGVDTIVPTVMTSLLQAQCIDGCARANYH